MGEKENRPFQLSFNGFLKVDFQGSRVTSDGGLVLVRELCWRLLCRVDLTVCRLYRFRQLQHQLAERGTLEVILTVDGVTANPVLIELQ